MTAEKCSQSHLWARLEETRGLCVACGFWLWWMEWRDRYLCHVTGSIITRNCTHAFAGCNTITFETLTYEVHFRISVHVHLLGIQVKLVYEGHRVKIKVTGAKRSKIPILAMLNCICNNSGSIKHTAMKFACSMGFSAMADWMVWLPSLSSDRSDHA